MAHLRLSCLLGVLTAAILLQHAAAAAESPPRVAGESEVKAAFVYNFAKFVNWPAGMIEDAPAVNLCMIGEDTFHGALEDVVRGHQVHGRDLRFRHISDPAAEADCSILFVSRSEEPRLGDILERAAEHSVLTVSDIPDFVARGGIIGMHVERSRIRFDVNLEVASRCRLNISSHLLKLAAKVKDSSQIFRPELIARLWRMNRRAV